MRIRILALLSIGALCGCASISDLHYNCVTSMRARSAWGQAKQCLPAECNTHDFARGYQDGYIEVSKGGNDCLPPVAPNCYWGPKFQTPEGLCRVRSWYNGYAMGARDAEAACRQQWHSVPSVPNSCGPCQGDHCSPYCIQDPNENLNMHQCMDHCAETYTSQLHGTMPSVAPQPVMDPVKEPAKDPVSSAPKT
jgi:hypothetical protein